MDKLYSRVLRIAQKFLNPNFLPSKKFGEKKNRKSLTTFIIRANYSSVSIGSFY